MRKDLRYPFFSVSRSVLRRRNEFFRRGVGIFGKRFGREFFNRFGIIAQYKVGIRSRRYALVKRYNGVHKIDRVFLAKFACGGGGKFFNRFPIIVFIGDYRFEQKIGYGHFVFRMFVKTVEKFPRGRPFIILLRRKPV